MLLEQDDDVLKWMMPAPSQFHLYYDHNSHKYIPDFIVETKTGIYIVETKREDEVEDSKVREKAEAAEIYCKSASDFTKTSGGKPWKYVIIPHTAVAFNASITKLLHED